MKPSGKFQRESEIGEAVFDSRSGVPVYLHDVVDVVRGYEDPPRLLNFRTLKPDLVAVESREVLTGSPVKPPLVWTTRAITLAIRHIKGTHISEFSADLDAALASLRGVLPEDLRIERTSDEPAQVRHKIEQFDDCILEAIVIVVAVALLFMEWPAPCWWRSRFRSHWR